MSAIWDAFLNQDFQADFGGAYDMGTTWSIDAIGYLPPDISSQNGWNGVLPWWNNGAIPPPDPTQQDFGPWYNDIINAPISVPVWIDPPTTQKPPRGGFQWPNISVGPGSPTTRPPALSNPGSKFPWLLIAIAVAVVYMAKENQ